MLGTKTAIATLPVRDLKAARRFYEDVLRLTPTDDHMAGVVAYATGGAGTLVYETPLAGRNDATAVTWRVGDDLDAIVADLKTRGVTFEHYDMPDTTLQGDIHVAGEIRVAWFKDPDRNIVCLVNG